MTSLSVDDNIKLASIEELNAATIFGLVDSNRSYLRQWLPWVDATKSPADTEEFLSLNRKLAAEGRALLFGILVEGQIAGVVGSNTIDSANRAVTIGYWLAESHQGRGIVSRCLKLVVAHAFQTLKVNRIVICAATGNAKSQRLAERLGFRREGVCRQAEWVNDRFVDSVMFALLRQDWTADGGS